MVLGAPLNLLWIIPAAAAIVALYLLRRPRRNLRVPSTLFWRILPQESARATRLQRLTPQLLLFVQLVAAVLLALAASQPKLREPSRGGRLIAFVIDNGASMGATDVPGARLARAIAIARARIKSAGRSDELCVVASAPARVVSAPATNATGATRAAGEITATDEPSDIVGAVADASAALAQAARKGERAEIELITDSSWPSSLDPAVQKASGLSNLSLTSVGSASAANLSISQLDVERDPAQPETRLQILATASAFGAPGSGTIRLSAAGKTLDTARVSPAPGRPVSAVFSIAAPTHAEALTASLSTSGRDDLASDNTAYAVLPAAGEVRVLLVSSPNSALARVLSLIPGLAVDETPPENYEAVGAPSGYDAIVLDGVAPNGNRPIPDHALIWGGIGPQFVAVGDTPTLEPVVDWDRSEAALRFVDLSDCSLTASAWSSVGYWKPLIVDSDGVIAASDEDGAQRRIWMSFQPSSSGFSKEPAFPIFVSNAIGWLSAQAGSAAAAGTPIALAPVEGGWSVHGPAFSVSGICDRFGSPCAADTHLAGVYTASSKNGVLLFARNVSPESSDIVPKPHDIALAPTGVMSDRTKHSVIAPVTALVAGVCLAILLLEWALYHRPRLLTPAVKPQHSRL